MKNNYVDITTNDLQKIFKNIRWNNPISVTLTLKKSVFHNGVWEKIDRIKVDRNTTHFFNRLNKKIYKNSFRRYGKKIRSFVTVGGDGDWVNYHLHMCLEKPNHVSYEQFCNLISECNSKTTFGNDSKDIQPMYSDGWITYMMEQRTKTYNTPDTIEMFSSSVDWLNSNFEQLN